jgi:hypothetical protein
MPRKQRVYSARIETDLQQGIENALNEARERAVSKWGYVGALELELYCSNPQCDVREVTMIIKEYEAPDTPSSLTCPSCRQQLKCHHVLTAIEQRKREQRMARLSVNQQILESEVRAKAIAEGRGEAPIAFPLTFDDSLPPMRAPRL